MNNKNILTIKEKIRNLFNFLSLTNEEIDFYLNFILIQFSYEFPSLRIKYIQKDIYEKYLNNDQNLDFFLKRSIINNKSDKEKISFDISKFDIFPIIKIEGCIYNFQNEFNYNNSNFILNNNLNISSFGYYQNDIYYYELLNQYKKSFKNKFFIPQIFSDIDKDLNNNDNNLNNLNDIKFKEYILISKDNLPCLIFYYIPRIISTNQNIDDYIYKILEPFIIYKFVDYLSLQNIQYTFDIIIDSYEKSRNIFQNIIDLFQSSLNSESLKEDDIMILKGINLGGLSIQYDLKDKDIRENFLKNGYDILNNTIKNLNESNKINSELLKRIKEEYYKIYLKQKKTYMLNNYLNSIKKI